MLRRSHKNALIRAAERGEPRLIWDWRTSGHRSISLSGRRRKKSLSRSMAIVLSASLNKVLSVSDMD